MTVKAKLLFWLANLYFLKQKGPAGRTSKKVVLKGGRTLWAVSLANVFFYLRTTVASHHVTAPPPCLLVNGRWLVGEGETFAQKPK